MCRQRYCNQRPLVHQALAEPTSERRPDLGVDELEFGGLNRRRIRRECRFRLAEGACRLVKCICCYPTLLVQHRIAVLRCARIVVGGRIMPHLSLRLAERDLVIPRIDLVKQLALLDIGAIRSAASSKIAGYLRPQCDGADRLGCPDIVEIDWDCPSDDQRHRPGMAAACTAAPAFAAPWPEAPSGTRPIVAAATAVTAKPAVVADKRMAACSDGYSPGAVPRPLWSPDTVLRLMAAPSRRRSIIA